MRAHFTLSLCKTAQVCFYCKYLCRNAYMRLCVYVIHHSKHQMTSPPTPILQLLPFHPPHTLHSKGLAGFHHAPSSSPSSSVPHALHLTELWFCGESAESSLLASLYTRLTWVRCRVCSCVPARVYFSIWGGGFVINTVSPLSPYTLVRL